MLVAMTQEMGKTMNESMKPGPRAVGIAGGLESTVPPRHGGLKLPPDRSWQPVQYESRRGPRLTHSNPAVQLLPLIMRQTLSGGQSAGSRTDAVLLSSVKSLWRTPSSWIR